MRECECVWMCVACTLVLLLLLSVEFLRRLTISYNVFSTDTLTKYKKWLHDGEGNEKKNSLVDQILLAEMLTWSLINSVLLTMRTSYLTIYSIVCVTG